MTKLSWILLAISLGNIILCAVHLIGRSKRYRIQFDPESWAEFKKHVDRAGENQVTVGCNPSTGQQFEVVVHRCDHKH